MASSGAIESGHQMCMPLNDMLLLFSQLVAFMIFMPVNIYCITNLYLYFYGVERKMARYSFQGRVNPGLVSDRKMIAKQGILFILANVVTYVPPMFLFIKSYPFHTVIDMICAVLFPCQG